MAAAAGFSPEDFDVVFIALDKMDKIGPEGVGEILRENSYPEGAADRYLAMFDHIGEGAGCADFCSKACPDTLENEVARGIDTIMESVRLMVDEGVSIVFDPTLVRGMSYYTGTIFEITIDHYNFSIAGGGRYDEMIGRFSNQAACACGFSIGFERIVTILKDLGWKEPDAQNGGTALLVDEKSGYGRLGEVFSLAASLRREGKRVTVQPLKKNAKFQVETLEKSGYDVIRKIYGDTQL